MRNLSVYLLKQMFAEISFALQDFLLPNHRSEVLRSRGLWPAAHYMFPEQLLSPVNIPATAQGEQVTNLHFVLLFNLNFISALNLSKLRTNIDPF